ncbi:GDSL-type esterase/lipase family protein [Dyadobacter sp. CY323]|uniref:GDSL-type esterase/lipase family protein n=1 Tax=Dyadobacter sp. CY323 TaxID=2907302 RepID=UPI001F26E0A3|nr:GDSL-type esterase/lipase family protein [Dyadobacter sp. CY323]MCE6991696.1 GDSL-type esterase/lipase family protein [Dyadobacter sp. CY323]
MKKFIFIGSLALNFIALCVVLLYLYRKREPLIEKIVDRKGSAHIVMLGDSHIQNGKWNMLLGRTDVKTIGWGGFTSEQVALLLPLVLSNKPKYCFVLCGFNDIGKRCYQASNVVENLNLLADSLQKHNIIPVFQEPFYQYDNPKVNASIDSIRLGIKQLCKIRNIKHIDLNPFLSDKKQLRQDLQKDRIHLNDKGYEIWAAQLKSFIKTNNI